MKNLGVRSGRIVLSTGVGVLIVGCTAMADDEFCRPGFANPSMRVGALTL